jgi:hypothetical protein
VSRQKNFSTPGLRTVVIPYDFFLNFSEGSHCTCFHSKNGRIIRVRTAIYMAIMWFGYIASTIFIPIIFTYHGNVYREVLELK